MFVFTKGHFLFISSYNLINIHFIHFKPMISLQSRRNFGQRVLGISLMKIMAAIFDFNGRKKFVPRGRSTIKYKEKGRGGEVKIMPARSHCYFGKLRSPTNGVPDWCG